MNYLLDTHCFLWSLFAPRKLSASARRAISDPANGVAVSSVSFWEIGLKFGLGKLDLKGVTPEDLPAAARSMGLDLLPLDAETAAGAGRLQRERHKDPFDRMLIWQAIRNNLVLVPHDREITWYQSLGLKCVT
ncbi:MAG: type II toxin-antitoxin system VapC family toxin [Burkholderiales bacterium]